MFFRSPKVSRAGFGTILLCTIMLLSGCIYQTEEDVYLDPIEPPDGSGSFVDLTSADEPILVKEPTTFQFSIQPKGKKAYHVSVALDSYPVFSETLNRDVFAFSIDPANFQEGTKTLSVVVTYLSGSLSLAGQLDAETITFQQDFIVIVEKLPAAPKPQVYIEDGKSMISWDPPAKDNYDNIVLRRVYYRDSFPFKVEDLPVPDKDAVVFHDTEYRGGDVSYSVILKDGNLQTEGAPTFFTIEPLTVEVDSLASPYPLMRWERSPLYNNDLVIKIINHSSHPIDQPAELEFPMTLGMEKILTINVVPNSQSSNEGFLIVKEVYMGIKIPDFYGMHYYPTDNSYIFGGGGLRKVDADTWTEAASSASPGNLLVTDDHLNSYYMTPELLLVKFDPVSLAMISSFNLRDVPGIPAGSLIEYGKVTNDNLLACRFDGVSVVIDLVARSVVWSMEWANLPELSPDGNFLFNQGTLLSRTEDGWETVAGQLNSWTSDWPVAFRQNDANQMIMKTADELLVYDLDAVDGGSLVPARTESISSTGKYMVYQAYSNTIHINRSVGGTEALYVYDANTFEVVRVSPEESYLLKEKVFENGHLFHTSGFYLP